MDTKALNNKRQHQEKTKNIIPFNSDVALTNENLMGNMLDNEEAMKQEVI